MGFWRGVGENQLLFRDIRRVGDGLHCGVVGNAQHVKVDRGGEASRQSANFAPPSRFGRTGDFFGASLIFETLVESSLEELLVGLAHVDPVVGARVLLQAADGAGGLHLPHHHLQLASCLQWFAPVHTRQ